MTLLLNIIGAGKLGKTLGFILQQSPEIEILGIVNQKIESAIHACEFIGAGKPYYSIQELPAADITLLAVPDKEIINIIEQLESLKCIKPKSILFHCSGALPSTILKKLPVYELSLHPIKSFASPEVSIHEFSNTICTYEGHQYAIEKLIPILSAIGARCLPISSDNKSLYHAGCVMACNYLVTLADIAQNTFINAGLSKENAFNSVIQLMNDTLINLKNTKSTRASLTGPLQRGDGSTIAKHLDVIEDPEVLQMYSMLGQATLKLTFHDIKVLEELKNLLNRISKHE